LGVAGILLWSAWSRTSADPVPQQAAARPAPPPPDAAPKQATAQPPPPPLDAAPLAEAAQPDAAKPEPAGSGVAQGEPLKPEEPVNPEPVQANPEPVTPDPPPTESNAVLVEATMAGRIKALLRGPRSVKKGETLFQIIHVGGDPAKIKELTAK